MLYAASSFSASRGIGAGLSRGADFDLRRFHVRLLSQGAIPLSLLETLIADWIEFERERLAEETSLLSSD